MPETLRITVLGSGTSSGVPTIGCSCATCASIDPRDNRLRPSVLVQYGGKNVLIDTTPDFRAQALRTGISRHHGTAAGPMARAMLMPSELSATALLSSLRISFPLP